MIRLLIYGAIGTAGMLYLIHLSKKSVQTGPAPVKKSASEQTSQSQISESSSETVNKLEQLIADRLRNATIETRLEQDTVSSSDSVNKLNTQVVKDLLRTDDYLIDLKTT